MLIKNPNNFRILLLLLPKTFQQALFISQFQFQLMSFIDSIVSIFSPPDPDFKQIPQGDAIRGKRVFQDICAECHNLHSYDGDAQAPKLGKLFGRKPGSTAFQASSALSKANFKWSEYHLFKFLRHPQKYIPGINMTWYGTRNIQERADLIAFLKKNC